MYIFLYMSFEESLLVNFPGSYVSWCKDCAWWYISQQADVLFYRTWFWWSIQSTSSLGPSHSRFYIQNWDGPKAKYSVCFIRIMFYKIVHQLVAIYTIRHNSLLYVWTRVNLYDYLLFTVVCVDKRKFIWLFTVVCVDKSKFIIQYLQPND
jgi:hypothetical protein